MFVRLLRIYATRTITKKIPCFRALLIILLSLSTVHSFSSKTKGQSRHPMQRFMIQARSDHYHAGHRHQHLATPNVLHLPKDKLVIVTVQRPDQSSRVSAQDPLAQEIIVGAVRASILGGSAVCVGGLKF
jgi:hypothetical protein